MITSKDIIKTFSYSETEQQTFSYLRDYMNLIKNKLYEIENDEEKLRKFALAGLFLTYRAFNHWGESMTTEINDSFIEDIHTKRVKMFKEYFGVTITDTSHYLSMINCSFLCVLLWMLRIKNMSKKLHKFVVS